MDSVINLIATLGVAGIGVVGIWIQTRSKERQESIESKLDLLRKESAAEDKKILCTLESNHRETLKLWLVNEMTKIRDGAYIPNEEQKRMLHDAKKSYNDLDGDSYVDDMFEDLREKHLI